MQCNKTFYEAIKWTACLVVLMSSFLLSGCDSQAKAPQSTSPPEVATVTVSRQRAILTTDLPGRTSAYRISEIRPQVNGIILKRLFTEGADVKAGEVLYQIDPAPFQAALDNAKAALGRAEANLPAIRLRANRYQELLADKAVSQQEVDDAAAALKQVQADIQYGKATVEAAPQPVPRREQAAGREQRAKRRRRQGECELG